MIIIVWVLYGYFCLTSVFNRFRLFLYRNADEVLSWIAEKASLLSADELGKDVVDAQNLRRNHETIIGDLTPIEDKASVALEKFYFSSIIFI